MSTGLQRWSSLNDPHQHEDDGNHQQNVNEPAHRVAAHQSEQPQNDQYHSDRVQHLILLPGDSGSLPAGAPAPASSDPRVSGLRCALLDGHVIDDTLHAGDVAHQFGDQILFGCVLRLTTQRDHAVFGLNLGVERAG